MKRLSRRLVLHGAGALVPRGLLQGGNAAAIDAARLTAPEGGTP